MKTVEQILILRNIIVQSVEWHSTLYINFINDSIHRDSLRIIMVSLQNSYANNKFCHDNNCGDNLMHAYLHLNKKNSVIVSFALAYEFRRLITEAIWYTKETHKHSEANTGSMCAVHQAWMCCVRIFSTSHRLGKLTKYLFSTFRLCLLTFSRIRCAMAPNQSTVWGTVFLRIEQ